MPQTEFGSIDLSKIMAAEATPTTPPINRAAVPDNVPSSTAKLASALNLPLPAANSLSKSLASAPEDVSSTRIGHFLSSGDLYVYVDSTNIDNLIDPSVAKRLAYNYRLTLGLAAAGIERVGGIQKLIFGGEEANPPSLFPDQDAWRSLFQLSSPDV
jgi:hypothetical protein